MALLPRVKATSACYHLLWDRCFHGFVVVVESLSHVRLFCDLLDCSTPGFFVHGISQTNEFPFPSPGDFPIPGIEPASPALAGRFFTTEPPGKPPSLRIFFKAPALFETLSADFLLPRPHTVFLPFSPSLEHQVLLCRILPMPQCSHALALVGFLSFVFSRNSDF